VKLCTPVASAWGSTRASLTPPGGWPELPNVGALPVCGEDDRLIGIITDRDMVVKAIAKGKNPAEVKAGDLIGDAHVWWVDAGADVDEVLHQMAEHKIRRLPVLENNELVGIISQADLAAKLPEDKVGELVEAISSRSR
jgi:Predicted signal-transduction protein containing cAMP-binding and CBS domains